MIAVILVIHLFVIVALVATILIQKSEGGALGIGGGGMSGFMTGRSTANLLTRTTAGLAIAFFVISLALAVLAGHGRVARSIVDQGPAPASETPGAPVSAPAAPSPTPAAPPQPSAPLAK